MEGALDVGDAILEFAEGAGEALGSVAEVISRIDL